MKQSLGITHLLFMCLLAISCGEDAAKRKAFQEREAKRAALIESLNKNSRSRTASTTKSMLASQPMVSSNNNLKSIEKQATSLVSKAKQNTSSSKPSNDFLDESSPNKSKQTVPNSISDNPIDYSIIGNWESSFMTGGYQWSAYCIYKDDKTYELFVTSKAAKNYRFGTYEYKLNSLFCSDNKGASGNSNIFWSNRNTFIETAKSGSKLTYYRTNKSKPQSTSKSSRIIQCPYCAGEAQLSVCDLNVAGCLTASQAAYDCSYKIDCCKCKGRGLINLD